VLDAVAAVSNVVTYLRRLVAASCVDYDLDYRARLKTEKFFSPDARSVEHREDDHGADRSVGWIRDTCWAYRPQARRASEPEARSRVAIAW
jgi:hypothetical protein